MSRSGQSNDARLARLASGLVCCRRKNKPPLLQVHMRPSKASSFSPTASYKSYEPDCIDRRANAKLALHPVERLEHAPIGFGIFKDGIASVAGTNLYEAARVLLHDAGADRPVEDYPKHHDCHSCCAFAAHVRGHGHGGLS